VSLSCGRLGRFHRAKEEFNDVSAGVLTAPKLTSLEWQLVPENLIGMGEQEPNPVRRHSNQDGRKEQTG
jgi:hypothetical protein